MIYIGGPAHSETTAWSLLDMPWVANGISANEIKIVNVLAQIDRQGYADISERLFDMQWVADGVSHDDSTVAHRLLPIILFAPDSAVRLIDMPFLQTIEQADVRTLYSLLRIARGNPDDLSDILAHPQFKDGITDDQAAVLAVLIENAPNLVNTLLDLEWVVDEVWNEDEELAVQRLAWLGATAMRLMDMPFLQTLEHADVMALRSLSRIAHGNPDDLADILAHPQLKNGITDDQTMIVAMLRPVLKHAPNRVDKLLDPNATAVEQRIIELPLSGEVELAIVRTYLRTWGTLSSMDLLENAVRETEKLMDAPLQLSHIWLLFENAVQSWYAGVNWSGNFMVIRPEYDLYAPIIAHEVGHYYWSGNADWLDEGMAEVMASVIERERTGIPVRATNAPCRVVENIMELEALAPEGGEPGFRCNYSLGEGLFLDLLQRLGEDAFWEGVRKLYAKGYAEGYRYDLGIEDVRQSFGPDADAIISRWRGG